MSRGNRDRSDAQSAFGVVSLPPASVPAEIVGLSVDASPPERPQDRDIQVETPSLGRIHSCIAR